MLFLGHDLPDPMKTATTEDDREQLPADVGCGNFMCGTWTVGNTCRPEELAEKLKKAPYDLCVLQNGGINILFCSTDDKLL